MIRVCFLPLLVESSNYNWRRQKTDKNKRNTIRLASWLVGWLVFMCVCPWLERCVKRKCIGIAKSTSDFSMHTLLLLSVSRSNQQHQLGNHNSSIHLQIATRIDNESRARKISLSVHNVKVTCKCSFQIAFDSFKQQHEYTNTHKQPVLLMD